MPNIRTPGTNPYLNPQPGGYSTQQIRDYAIGNGWADASGNILNPQGIYGAAQQYGISANQLDQAGNWANGTAANYIQQQGWNPLTGAPAVQAGGAPPNPYLGIGNSGSTATGTADITRQLYGDQSAHNAQVQQLASQGANAPGGPPGSSNGLTSIPNFEAAYQQSQQQIANGTAGGSENQQPTTPGYTPGPAGSSGGLTAGSSPNPYPVGYVGPNGQQMNPAPSTTGSTPATLPAGNGNYGVNGQGMQHGPTGGWQYGYGNAPGQSNRGYYEQQTPAGSFAASERTQAPRQQYAQTYGAGNNYIGRTSQGIGGAQSVLPYAQQIAQAGQQANPYLGAQTQQVGSAGTNPLIGRNPYLDNQINDALRQSSDSFQATVLPQFDSMARRSGSFGNTGVEAARQRAIDNFGRNQSAMANNAYLQDYQTSQGLQENALNRTQAVNMANAGFNAGDLARNLGGAFTGQQLGMQGLSSLLGAGQFDSTMGQQGNMFNATMGQNDLSRNSQLAQQLGMFNAGNLNTNSMFNAGQGNSMNQYLAGLNQANNQFNAGSANSMLSQVRNLNEQGRQFDENLDWGIDRDNWNRMRTGSQDQIDLVGRLMGWNQNGINNATQLQNIPLQYLQQLSQIGMGLGGLGTSSTQQLNGNPWLGALGGWQLMSQLLGNGGG